MMRIAMFVAVCALVLTAAVPSTSAESMLRWKNVGGDPCNPKVGCTLEWALTESQWPLEVQERLIEAVRHSNPERTEICSGWNGWMTWGSSKRKFHSNVIAYWSVGHCEPVLQWSVEFASVGYNLIKVQACGNWGGYIAPYVQSEKPSGPPLGTVPIVSCPEEKPERRAS